MHCTMGKFYYLIRMKLPNEFNADVYRRHNVDLSSFSDENLLHHWNEHGEREGRIASAVNNRDRFLGLLHGANSLLEIGVFDNPTIDFLNDGKRVIHYADWLSKDDLVKRANDIPGRNSSMVPEIRWILADGYKQIRDRYDIIVSHHCVEHQPDLITHFHNVKSIASANGGYFFSLPDKRHCFDHYIPESTIVDLVEAYYMRREAPAFKSVLEHRCFTRHSYRDGINPYLIHEPYATTAFERAYQEYLHSDYVDVHCWQFTPFSFKTLYNQLVGLGLLPTYRDLKVYSGGSEFYVALLH